MANVNAAFGLKPIRMSTGSKNVPLEEFTVADGYTTKIFDGDVVEMTGTGRNVVPAAAGNADNIGVFVGCRYEDINGKVVHSNYYPGDANATNIIALVSADPNIVYEAMCDTLAAGDVGALADWEAVAGNVLYGRSNYEVDVSAGTGTSGKSLRILGLVRRANNEYGAYAVAEVMFAEHARIPGGGVGV